MSKGLARWASLLAMALLVWLAADVTWAQDLQPIQNVAQRLLSAMTGEAAALFAACAIAATGYLYYSTQIDSRQAVAVIVGIALVFGSLTIAQAFRSAVGSPTVVLGR